MTIKSSSRVGGAHVCACVAYQEVEVPEGWMNSAAVQLLEIGVEVQTLELEAVHYCPGLVQPCPVKLSATVALCLQPALSSSAEKVSVKESF